jgi:hypothetical protein
MVAKVFHVVKWTPAELERTMVTGFVADEISTNMHAGEPRLVVGERICWRVPVILSMPPSGDRGEVGTIDVDVETGQVMITQALIQEIERRAEYFDHPTPSAGSSTIAMQ